MARRRRAPRRDADGIAQLPWTRVDSALAPVEILSPDQLEAIHDASLHILENFGIEVMSADACRRLGAAGAEVDHTSGLVRFDRNLVLDLVSKAPGRVTLTPRNPDRAIALGGSHINFGLVAGPPNIHDRIHGRRDGNYADYCNLLRLAQSLNIIHVVGNQPTAPVELDAATRHLDCYRANVTYTDRVFHCSAIGRERALDGIDVAAIARGKTRAELIDDPSVVTIISVNSPRRLDGPMADGLIAMAEWGQGVCVTPFTLMGAMTPVTLPAALAQQNAEALAGIALTQIVRPGAPAIYGAFTSNVDMKSGAPAFGTPENARAQLAAGQLARRYGLPYRASNANASNAVDAQAAYESQNDIWAGMMGHANLLYHGAGWLEGGLTASFEKVVLDAELLQMAAELVKPVAVTADTLALDAIGDVGPGGHFFGTEHTMARYETAFYAPILSDWRNYENWLEAGGATAEVRATRIWQQLLETYQQPAMEPGNAEALDAFVARRKEALAGRER